MKIASTQYSLKYESFEIYLSGCDGYCGDKCHNKELWDFNLGTDYKLMLPSVIDKIKEFDLLIKWIWILGGEPLLQDISDLIDLLRQLRKTEKPIVLFTRFELEDIPIDVIDLCDYIKTGPYLPKFRTDDYHSYGIPLATSNQRVHYIGTAKLCRS